jgi:hypothetical protein
MLMHWDFKDLACCSIAEIRLIALNVTTPRAQRWITSPQHLIQIKSSDPLLMLWTAPPAGI